MSVEKIVVRGLLRHFWKKGLSAKAAAEEICAVEGEGTVHRNTAANWFKRFNSGDTSLQDLLRSGRPSEVDDGLLLESVARDPHSTTRELCVQFQASSSTISRHLRSNDVQHKQPRQDPHELSEPQAQQRIDTCKMLLQNPLDDRFWKRIITSDEKWIF